MHVTLMQPNVELEQYHLLLLSLDFICYIEKWMHCFWEIKTQLSLKDPWRFSAANSATAAATRCGWTRRRTAASPATAATGCWASAASGNVWTMANVRETILQGHGRNNHHLCLHFNQNFWSTNVILIWINVQVRESVPHMQQELYLDTRGQLQQ